MDLTARELLAEARRHYAHLGFIRAPVVALSETRLAIATIAGTVKTTTLALTLRAHGFTVETFDGFLTVTSKEGAQDLHDALQRLASGEPISLFGDQTNLIFEKFHAHLTRELLELDVLSAKVDAAALEGLCRRIMSVNVSSFSETGQKGDQFSD